MTLLNLTSFAAKFCCKISTKLEIRRRDHWRFASGINVGKTLFFVQREVRNWQIQFIRQLILSGMSFIFYHSLKSPLVAVNQFSAVLSVEFGPFLLTNSLKISKISWISCPDVLLEHLPHVFNGVKVRILRGPFQNLNPFGIEESIYLTRRTYLIFIKKTKKYLLKYLCSSMYRRIILLEPIIPRKSELLSRGC